MKIGELLFDVVARTAGFSKGMKSVEGDAKRFQATMTGLKRAIGTAVGGITAGMFLKASVKEFIEAEKAVTKLNFVVKTAGRNLGLTAQEISSFADAMAAVTEFDDEAFRDAASALTKFTNVKGQTFLDVIAVSADIAARSGEDLLAVVEKVGRAVNDPAKAGKILRPLGITEAQFKTSGGDVLGLLKANFGGGAAEQLKTLGGQSAQLSKAFDELKEAVGGFIASLGLAKGIKGITTLLGGDKTTAGGVLDDLSTRKRGGLFTQDAIRARMMELTNESSAMGGKLDAGGFLANALSAGGVAAGRAVERQLALEAIDNELRVLMIQFKRLGAGGKLPGQSAAEHAQYVAAQKLQIGQMDWMNRFGAAFGRVVIAPGRNTLRNFSIMEEEFGRGISEGFMKSGKEMRRSLMNPAERAGEEIMTLKALRTFGAITDETFIRGVMRAREQLQPSMQFAGAATIGSAEAASAIFRARDPLQQEARKIAQKQLDELKRANGLLDDVKGAVKDFIQVVF